MAAYLFLIRYQFDQWSVLSFDHFFAYGAIHFPDGILSEFQEEASYRGLLFGLAIPLLGPVRANLFQATVFLLLHYIGVAHGHMDVMRSLSTFLLGLVFCGFRIGSTSLLLPTFFHILWNLISTFLFLSIEQSWRP
jgi:membrane protease YdiL (CAAX protease family)